jgi:phenylacetate-CoA ligase
MGIRPRDTVLIGSFFSLYMGSWGAFVGAERLGASVFPLGAGVPGHTQRAVNWMAQMRPTVFYGTPSYALRIAEIADEMKVDPLSFGIERMFFSGEPGASVPVIRKQITERFGARVFDSGSMAEVSPWMNLGETTESRGMLCWQDIVYTEVVDPHTYRRVPYGMEGTPIYTTLERTSQPMIRLLSKDLTRWEEGPSDCGRTYPSLPRGVYGRIDDMFTIRGENVYPSTVDETLRETANYGGEHRIIISRSTAMDVLRIQVEYSPEFAASPNFDEDLETWRQEIGRTLQTRLGVGASVDPVPPGRLERTEFKARRVVDERDVLAVNAEGS